MRYRPPTRPTQPSVFASAVDDRKIAKVKAKHQGSDDNIFEGVVEVISLYVYNIYRTAEPAYYKLQGRLKNDMILTSELNLTQLKQKFITVASSRLL